MVIIVIKGTAQTATRRLSAICDSYHCDQRSSAHYWELCSIICGGCDRGVCIDLLLHVMVAVNSRVDITIVCVLAMIVVIGTAMHVWIPTRMYSNALYVSKIFASVVVLGVTVVIGVRISAMHAKTQFIGIVDKDPTYFEPGIWKYMFFMVITTSDQTQQE